MIRILSVSHWVWFLPTKIKRKGHLVFFNAIPVLRQNLKTHKKKYKYHYNQLYLGTYICCLVRVPGLYFKLRKYNLPYPEAVFAGSYFRKVGHDSVAFTSICIILTKIYIRLKISNICWLHKRINFFCVSDAFLWLKCCLEFSKKYNLK